MRADSRAESPQFVQAQADGYNCYLNEALDAFQKTYDGNQDSCATRLRQGRQFVTDFQGTVGANVTSPLVDNNDTWADYSTQFEHTEETRLDRDGELPVRGWCLESLTM
jgi:hypothetical protein